MNPVIHDIRVKGTPDTGAVSTTILKLSDLEYRYVRITDYPGTGYCPAEEVVQIPINFTTCPDGIEVIMSEVMIIEELLNADEAPDLPK